MPLCRVHPQFVINKGSHEPCPAQTDDARRIPRMGGTAMRYEFDGIGPVAMTGGTYGDSTIQGNLATAVGGHLRGKPCRFHGSDLKFQVAEGHVRYPDGMVV